MLLHGVYLSCINRLFTTHQLHVEVVRHALQQMEYGYGPGESFKLSVEKARNKNMSSALVMFGLTNQSTNRSYAGHFFGGTNFDPYP